MLLPHIVTLVVVVASFKENRLPSGPIGLLLYSRLEKPPGEYEKALCASPTLPGRSGLDQGSSSTASRSGFVPLCREGRARSHF